jgi:glycyl-tRNA synthetase beta subunit
LLFEHNGNGKVLFERWADGKIFIENDCKIAFTNKIYSK